PVTADEKIQKKNDVEARIMLLMALPNEHLMTLNQYKDAKSLFDVITTRFEVKRNAGPSSSFGPQNMAFVSTPSTSNNDNVSIVFGVSTASLQVSTANLSDANVYAFLANQPNVSQLVHEDLEQIHEDDLEEMDLKWQLALLSMRAKRFFQKTGKKITINGSDIAGYDKAKVECLNCHKMRMTVNVEVTSSKAMVAIDGADFDWTYMADDEALTNIAFMDFQTQSYNVVQPPYTERFSPLRIDLSHTGLPEFAEPSVESYGVKPIEVVTQTSSVKISKLVKENNDAPHIKDWESEGDDEVESPPEINRKTVKPSGDKVEVDIPKQNDKPARRPVKYDEMYKTQRPRGNQKNWNNLKFHQLGSSFVMENKACYACGRLNHLQARCKYDQRERMVNGTNHSRVDHSANTVPKEFDGGYVAFGGGAKGGKITRKGIIKTIKLDFEDVYFVQELKFNLFSVLHMCDKKNSLLFTNTGCFVLSPDFKLADESHVLLKVPRRRTSTKDETSRIFKSFITEIEKLVDKKVKIIRCDNGIEFKNRVMNEFYKEKGIKREYSVARTPQQHRVVERRNRTLIENRVLVVKPHSKTSYELFRGTNSNNFAGKGASLDAGQSSIETCPSQDYILMPLWNDDSLFDSSLKDLDGDNKDNDGPCKETKNENKERHNAKNNTKDVNTVGPTYNDMRSLDRVEVDISNISTTYPVPTTLNTRIHKDYSLENVINDMQSGVQARRMIVTTGEQGFISAIYKEKTHEDLHICLFAYFLSQEEPKRITMDLPRGKRDIDTKWVFRNKKDKRGIVIRNKAMLVAQGFTQEEGIDYDEVFAIVARIEAIRLFLAYASFMGFLVYKMDIKSAFLYERIEEEVYVCQPPGFKDPDYPDKVYKVEKAIYGLHQASIACSTKKEFCTEFEELMHDKFQMSSIGELTFFLGLKFKYTYVKPASTPMDKEKALLNDSDGDDVDVHLYRSTIGFLMYLTSSRPDIMFDVYVDSTSTLPTTKIFEQLDLMRKTRTRTRRIGIMIPQSNVPSSVADEAITKEMHDGLGRATTIASSLEAELGSGNISKTQTKTTPSGPSSPRTSLEGDPGVTLP
nr:hypothetical protein [Tanacetum cinerariifolium]